MPWGFAAAAAGAIGGAVISGNAATSAANTQANAAKQATQVEQQQFAQTQGNLLPWLTTGVAANANLQNAVLGYNLNGNGALTQSPFNTLGQPTPYSFTQPVPQAPNPTLASFQSSPGYQYQLNQTLGAVQNSNAAQNGALSGNTLKALSQNATGLANQDWYNYLNSQLNLFNAQNTAYNTGFNTYNTGYTQNNQNYWNQYNALNNQNQQTFNMLQTLSGAGQNAGANLGSLGSQLGQSVGSNLIGAGNAQAAGTVGSANALTGGINSLLTAALSPSTNYNGSNSLLATLLGGGGGGANSAWATAQPV